MNRSRVMAWAICFVATGACLGLSEAGLRYVAGLKSDNQKEREQAAEAMCKERTEQVRELMALASAKVDPLPGSRPPDAQYPWHDAKHLSIIVLGDIRGVEAVPILMDELLYRNPKTLFVGELSFDRGSLYPAVEALIKIGLPAIEPTIKKLAEYHNDGTGRTNCCWIIRKVLGRRLGRLSVEIAIENTRDTGTKKNLEAALDYFKTPEEKAAENQARI